MNYLNYLCIRRHYFSNVQQQVVDSSKIYFNEIINCMGEEYIS